MKILKKVLVLICAFILLNLAPQICKAEELVKIDATYGIEGKFKGTSLTINVQLENKSDKNIDGQVQVNVPINSTYYDSYIVDLTLRANEKREINVPISLTDGEIPRLKIDFLQNDKVISEKKLTISSGRVNDNSMFMGILTDDYNGVLLKDIDISKASSKYYENQSIYSIALTKDILTNIKNIDSVDTIVINNYNTANLTKNEYDSLEQWVSNGGILIIGTGENSSKTIGNMDKEFLNNYIDSNKNIENKKVVVKESGLGKVYIASYDFSDSNILNDEGTNLYWIDTLASDFGKNLNSNNNSFLFLDLLNQVPNTEMYSIKTLAIVFIVYTLLIGLVIYFVFKKINKREYLWVTIPLIALVFTGLLFLIGNKTRLKDVALNQVSFIKKNKNGECTSEAYVGIASKYKSDLVINDPKEADIEILNFYDDYYSYNGSTNDAESLRSKIIYSGNDTSYEYKDLSALTMKNFKLKNTTTTVSDIEYNLKYSKDGINGSVKNTLGSDMKKLLLVSSGNIWDLGDVAENEEITIDGIKSVNTDLGSYGNNLLYNRSGNEAKDYWLGRAASILTSIYENNLVNDSVYLVAVTDIPIDYKFEFKNKSISQYDTTAIIQEVNINFNNEDGNCYYPLGYFGPNIVSTEVDNIYNQTIYGSGDIYLEYDIDKNVDVLALSIGYTKTDLIYSYNTELQGTMYIYNYSMDSYEEINYVENGLKLDNPKDYVRDNKVLVYLKCREEDSVKIPQIAVEGVYTNARN